jgi:hypothetical protein
MSRKQLAFALFWILVIGYALHSWYQRNQSTPSQYSPTSSEPANLPDQKKLKPANIEIKNYKYEAIDSYRFKVNFTAINTGDKPAQNIRIKIFPWQGGDYSPDNGADIDPHDPILQVEGEETIPRLEPKQSVDRSIPFYANPHYIPCRFPQGAKVTFTEVEP